MHRLPRILNSLIVLLTAAPLCSAVLLAPASAQPVRGGPPLPAKTVIPDEGVEVEMHRYNRLPMIEASINGQGPYRFVVDTGAAGVVLKEELANALELPAPRGMAAGTRIQVRAPGSDGISASVYQIDRLAIGEARIEGVFTIAMKLPFGDGIDGVIGMDVFHDCLLTYDYPNHRMSFHHGELPDVNNRDVLSYSNPRMPNSHPEIEMKIDGRPTAFLIDTGFRGWFAMSKEAIEASDVTQGPAEGEMGMSAGGLIPTNVSRIGHTITAGDFSVHQPIVRAMTANMNINIVGTLFLENFKVTFDAKNSRIQLADSVETSWTPASLRNPGFGIKNLGDHMVVWYVHPDSHASKIGLEAGDVILTVNDTPIQDVFDSVDWRSMLQDSDQMTVQYRSHKDDSVRTASVEIFEILPAADSSGQQGGR